MWQNKLTYTVVTAQSGSSRKDVHMLFPEEEKIIVEETRSNGQTVVEERCHVVFTEQRCEYDWLCVSGAASVSCRSLVDTVYSLKDELQELKQVSLRFQCSQFPVETGPNSGPVSYSGMESD